MERKKVIFKFQLWNALKKEKKTIRPRFDHRLYID